MYLIQSKPVLVNSFVGEQSEEWQVKEKTRVSRRDTFFRLLATCPSPFFHSAFFALFSNGAVTPQGERRGRSPGIGTHLNPVETFCLNVPPSVIFGWLKSH